MKVGDMVKITDGHSWEGVSDWVERTHHGQSGLHGLIIGMESTGQDANICVLLENGVTSWFYSDELNVIYREGISI